MPWTRPARRDQASARPSQESAAGLLRFVLIVAGIAWLVRSLIATPSSIPSGSMLPTLYVGDYVLVAKWPYGYSRYSFPFQFPPFSGRVLGSLPERGDVAVFRPVGAEMDFVKRVIGLPGDRIAVRDGRLFLNGQRVDRRPAGQFALPISANSYCKVVPPAVRRTELRNGDPHCIYPAFRETLPNGRRYTVLDQIPTSRGDDFAETRVPAGHLFLMGDNRDDSFDSRYSLAIGGIGFVPVDNLVGRASVTVWSTDGSAVYWKPWSWFTALRWDRIGNAYSGPSR